MRWFHYVILGLVAIVCAVGYYFYYVGNNDEAEKMAKVREGKAIKKLVNEETAKDETTPSDTEKD